MSKITTRIILIAVVLFALNAPQIALADGPFPFPSCCPKCQCQ